MRHVRASSNACSNKIYEEHSLACEKQAIQTIFQQCIDQDEDRSKNGDDLRFDHMIEESP